MILWYTLHRTSENTFRRIILWQSKSLEHIKALPDRFVEIKVRVTPEKRSVIKDHAESMGESATAFINRAIDEAMERDRNSKPEK